MHLLKYFTPAGLLKNVWGARYRFLRKIEIHGYVKSGLGRGKGFSPFYNI